MLTLDLRGALVAILIIGSIIYQAAIVPFQEYKDAQQDKYSANMVGKALINEFYSQAASTQCPVAPTGVTINKLISNSSLDSSLVVGRLFTTSIAYTTVTINTPTGFNWKRTTGATVNLTYQTQDLARLRAGYIRPDDINGRILTFHYPINHFTTLSLSSHVDPNTGCGRKLDE